MKGEQAWHLETAVPSWEGSVTEGRGCVHPWLGTDPLSLVLRPHLAESGLLFSFAGVFFFPLYFSPALPFLSGL